MKWGKKIATKANSKKDVSRFFGENIVELLVLSVRGVLR